MPDLKEYNNPIDTLVHKRLAKLLIYFCKRLISSSVLIEFNYKSLFLKYFTEMHVSDMSFYEEQP